MSGYIFRGRLSWPPLSEVAALFVVDDVGVLLREYWADGAGDNRRGDRRKGRVTVIGSSVLADAKVASATARGGMMGTTVG